MHIAYYGLWMNLDNINYKSIILLILDYVWLHKLQFIIIHSKIKTSTKVNKEKFT